MELELDLKESAAANASMYFEQSKKLEKKGQKAREILRELENRLKTEQEKKTVVREVVKKELLWYEKFHWFRLPDGRLVLGGRDATTNEIVIKKHTEPHDFVFHTESPGSPFFVIKTEGKPVPPEWFEGVAEAVASYSNSWKLRTGISDVYWVAPDQVSKEAPSGEYMGKGAFMIRGKRNYLRPELRLAVGWDGENVIGGPISHIVPLSKKYLIIKPGYTKPSDIAKKAAKWFGTTDVDAVLRFLPAGKSDIVESK